MTNLRMESIYTDQEKYEQILWDLLKERTPEQSISHRGMPSLRQHLKFIDSRPYRIWNVILMQLPMAGTEEVVGSCYLTNQYEIGINVFNAWQNHGIGPWAVNWLIERHPSERLLANINPKNERSIRMFEKLGFTHIQNTYELRKP